MRPNHHHGKPTIGILAGWQFYRTATNLSYLAPVFRGVSRAAQDLGCNLLLGCGIGPSASPSDPLRPAWPDPLPDADFIPIGPWNTDGILIANPLHTRARSDYVQELIGTGHPVLFIGSGEKGPMIVADNFGGIQEAMRHLVDHGHRRIAFIAGSMEDLGGDSGDRLYAYQSFLESYHLEVNPKLVAYGRHVFDGGYSAMMQILENDVPFTAVVASNDESALGAMQALEDSGMKIPENVAIIGFDNRLEGAVHEPGLSSIHVPLFNMGYQALNSMYLHLEEKAALRETIKVGTRLVARASCGCSPAGIGLAKAAKDQKPQVTKSMLIPLLNQAHSLTDEELETFCEQLVDAFVNSLQHADGLIFQNALLDVLQKTAAVGDDTHIWQDVISVFGDRFVFGSGSAESVKEILEAARSTISIQAQKQYQHYILDERQISSRLILLTDRLLGALDESQIYDVLASHLPELGLHTALLATFEPDGDDPVAWSHIRDVTALDRPPVRIASRDFPPAGLITNDQPFILTLIPLVSRTAQLGYMVFGSEPLDLYGAIVQQLGGAFNTARLYRQAVEDRRLAEEANRMKSRFLSTISHELRTPLNLIVGLSGILLQENEDGRSPLPGSAQRDVERIHAYSQHLGGLIGDVLDLTSSDAGQLRLNKDFHKLGEILSMISESGQQLASDKGLSWRADIPEGGPWVFGDRTRLRQVALNLVNNAIKFTAQGEVHLRVETENGLVTVSVQDTGLGIPPEEHEAIFNEFDRSERSILLGYSGLGLGLAICKRLIEMHDGTIGVHSTGEEGAGATFYFTLPVVQPPADQTMQMDDVPKDQQLVVIVTSQAEASENLCRLLQERGIKVQISAMGTSSSWLSDLLGIKPDAMLLDAGLVSDHGWDALRSIKENPALGKIPVLFYRSSQDVGAVLELEYLTKPIELESLTRMLDQQWLMSTTDRSIRTILVVDDEPNTLELHARIVQSHSSSNRVLMAQNGRKALDILRQEVIDLVLLDLQMPEVDGFDVLDNMRREERLRGIPVIVVTGRMLAGTEMARLNHGVTAVLEKGLFSLDETVAHINTALERKHRLSPEAQRLVRKAMAYIHEHYSQAISRKDIAQHVNIAEDHLTFCFRQELGTTPIKYLQRYRVNQARHLLLESDKTITEIALMVGFSDGGYFSRLFHREMGISPDKFRNQ